jgi:23S rRNA (cytosine1962-C5)-methyltransferase
MVRHDDYALLDCGDGRRLERFGSLLANRPAPGAVDPRRTPDLWADAAVYHAGSGWWQSGGTPLGDDGITISAWGLTVEVRPSPSGQVGIYPEHAAGSAWLSHAARERAAAAGGRAVAAGGDQGRAEILNLFAATGFTTLVAAAAGAAVVHVDASRPSVLWARRNADLSGLADRPIRWIVDDALTFVLREARRGRRYSGFILDPPSYGHGGRGSRAAWQFDTGIAGLLEACSVIADPDAFWLLTSHSPGWDPGRLAATLRSSTRAWPGEIEAMPLELEAESGAVLRLGSAARLDPHGGDRR